MNPTKSRINIEFQKAFKSFLDEKMTAKEKLDVLLEIADNRKITLFEFRMILAYLHTHRKCEKCLSEEEFNLYVKGNQLGS